MQHTLTQKNVQDTLNRLTEHMADLHERAALVRYKIHYLTSTTPQLEDIGDLVELYMELELLGLQYDWCEKQGVYLQQLSDEIENWDDYMGEEYHS